MVGIKKNLKNEHKGSVLLAATNFCLKTGDCFAVSVYAVEFCPCAPWLFPAPVFLTWNVFFRRAITFLNHTMPDFTDNGASNFIKYGNDYFATSETNYIRMIDPATLETKDKVRKNPLPPPRGWVVWSPRSWCITSTDAGGLHEVPAGEPGVLPPPLRQRWQRLQHGNFHSREGQDQIRAVQSSRRCSKRYFTRVWVGCDPFQVK